jgi:hypothetical protein
VPPSFLKDAPSYNVRSASVSNEELATLKPYS